MMTEEGVRTLAHRPEHWVSPTNRLIAAIAKSLLDQGVPWWKVSKAVMAGYDVSGDLP